MKEWMKLVKATELFGKINTSIAKMPNKYILTYILESIDSISSNDIENIHTTVGTAYSDLITNSKTPFVKYREALKLAHKKLENSNLIRSVDIENINRWIRGVDEGFRKKNTTITKGNKVIYTPPSADKLPEEMDVLIKQINKEPENPIIHALDIHHKFEWIHPFNDGNGRTGRILFALLLSKYEVLDVPASVFSYSIMKNKERYYEALRLADKGKKDQYYEIMLDILIESLEELQLFIKLINEAIERATNGVENEKKKKIITLLFSGVKVSNTFLSKRTKLNRKTITKYINELIDEGMVTKKRYTKYVSYKNNILEKLIHKQFKLLK